LIVEEALEAESRDALGRDYYEHGAEPGRGYRNGVRPGRLKTAEGLIEFAAPQIAGRDAPFRSQVRDHLKGRTEALEGLAVELLARGLSVRETEQLVRRLQADTKAPVQTQTPRTLDPDIRKLQDELGERLSAQVVVQHSARGRGKLIIHYNNVDELDGILEHIR